MNNRGFTLLEVLVATALMAIAVAGLLSNLTTSMTNAARLTEYDRAALLARRKMDDLLAQRYLPKGVVMEGKFEGPFESGWRARAKPFEWRGDAPGPGSDVLERIELQVWWKSGTKTKDIRLETCRMTRLRDIDMGAVP